jgi:hypothetical protein
VATLEPSKHVGDSSEVALGTDRHCARTHKGLVPFRTRRDSNDRNATPLLAETLEEGVSLLVV